MLNKPEPNQQKIEQVLTAHGLGFRGGDVQRVFNSYMQVGLETKEQVAIIYQSMYGSTVQAAKLLAQGVQKSGLQPVLLNVQSFSNARIALDVFQSRGVMIGSPTLNGQMMPQLE